MAGMSATNTKKEEIMVTVWSDWIVFYSAFCGDLCCAVLCIC